MVIKMKKIIMSIIVIGWLFTSCIVTANVYDPDDFHMDLSEFHRAYPTADIYVDDDAPLEWYDETHVRTIQEGLDRSSSDDFVFVYNGIYYESTIWINKSVTLRGENKQTTIIDGNNELPSHIFIKNVKKVKISGFKIRNMAGTGPYLNSSSNITFFNNIFDCVFTAYMDLSHISIIKNIFTENIDLWGCSNSVISDNVFTLENNDGIRSRYGNKNVIKDNSFTNCDTGIYLSECDNAILKGNTITNASDEGIHILCSTNIEITENSLHKNDWGILLRGTNTNNIDIFQNTLDDMTYGIEITTSVCSVSITENILKNCHIGFSTFSRNNILKRNVITDCFYGIFMIFTNQLPTQTGNVITKNMITNNKGYGLYLIGSNDNLITDNHFLDNWNYVLCIANQSDRNIITGNNIIGNNKGIIIDDSSSANIFYRNNFINNNVNAYDAGYNIWYNLVNKRGNYWDDYDGLDSNGDGIGDTPHNIPPRVLFNVDRYPLIEPLNI
jgi:parallel beta-helix repeat protein